MEKFPYTPNHTIQPSKKFGSKFGPILGSFFLGALLIYFLFPREKTVERIVDRPVDRIVEKPVDRIVEKPVEVIRTVEKIVEVPAQLSDFQKTSEAVAKDIIEAESHQLGAGATAIYPASNRSVKVYIFGNNDEIFKYVSKSEIVARVESIFRRNGFVVYKDDGPYSPTWIVLKINLLPNYNKTTLSGSLRIEINQNVMGFAGGLWKKSAVVTSAYGETISYGSNNYYKISSEFESLAIEACNDLSAAGPTEKIK